MQDSVLDLASDGSTGAATAMVAQVATLARSFMHDVQAMRVAELEAHMAALARLEGDDATDAARDLVSRLLAVELQTRQTGADGLQTAAAR